MSPTDRSLQTDWEQEIDDAKEYVRKLNVISTNKDKEMEVDDEKDDMEVIIQRTQNIHSSTVEIPPSMTMNSPTHFYCRYPRTTTSSIRNGIYVKRC